MKRIIIFFLIVLFHLGLYAQAPQKMSYQAIIRGANGDLKRNCNLGVQISIQSSMSGGIAYCEQHNSVTTNENGLLTLEIGAGYPIYSSFNSLNWANVSYYIKIELDTSGGTNYSISYTNQLLSVPYALFAANGGSGSQGPQGPQGPQGIQGIQGIQGPAGANGLDGQDGKTVLNGTSDPSTAIGNIGDFYINTITNQLFGPKTNLSWGSGINLVGPQGPQGIPGSSTAGNNPGDMQYWNGSQWVLISGGVTGQTLSFCNGVPKWGPCETVAILTTSTPFAITSASANTGGNITSEGGAAVTTRGICYSTSPNPTTANNLITAGSGIGSFSTTLTGLTPNTTYYARAYAINSFGTAYGNQQVFTTTAISLSTLSTSSVSSITYTSAVSGGVITNDGGALVTARGVCWSTSQNPFITDPHTSNGTG